MAFESILGHEIPKRMITAAIERDRIAHAYLFQGPEGVGKRTFAVRFAAAILRGGLVDEDDALERRVVGDNHPDVVLFECEEGSDSVGVERVRELETEIERRPFEAPRRVFILDQCHRMTESASNALLKTLEEPPPGTVMILIADRLRGIPRTVLSRCQPVQFHGLDRDAVRAHLAGLDDVEDADTGWLAAASEGSIGGALRLAREGWGEVRTDLAERLTRPGGFGLDAAAMLSTACRKPAANNAEARGRIRTAIQLLSLIARDALVVASSGDEEGLYNPDLLSRIRPIAAGIGPEGALSLLQATFEAVEWLERNAHLELVLESLSLRVDEILAQTHRIPVKETGRSGRS